MADTTNTEQDATAATQQQVTDDKKFSQADLDRIVKERLAREKEKADAEAARARSEAEAEAAKKNGEFEKLAKQREGELVTARAEKESLAAQIVEYEALKTATQNMINAQIKDLPEATRELLTDLSPVKQLEWLAKHADQLAANGAQQTTTTNQAMGAGALPPRDQGGKPVSQEDRRAGIRARFGKSL